MSAPPDRFNRNVHGARGLFALFVFVFHIVNSGLPTWGWLTTLPALYILRSTEYGVELFFAISGYVIAGTLARARSPLAFLEDRAIRIYPPLWASVFAICGAGALTGLHGFGTIPSVELVWRLPVNMLALPGVLPIDNLHPAAWSLSYEMAFYAACALLWTLRTRSAARWWRWFVAVGCAAAFACYPRAIFFLSGGIVALGWLDKPSLRPLVRHPLPWLLLFLAAWAGVQCLTLPRHIIATTLFDWAGDARLPLAVLAFVGATLAFAGIAAGRGALSRALRSPLFQYAGTISYSFYLWHPIVMSGVKAAMVKGLIVAKAGDGAQLAFALLSLPPSLLTAHVSQRALERGAGLWLRRHLHHRSAMTIQEVAP